MDLNLYRKAGPITQFIVVAKIMSLSFLSLSFCLSHKSIDRGIAARYESI